MFFYFNYGKLLRLSFVACHYLFVTTDEVKEINIRILQQKYFQSSFHYRSTNHNNWLVAADNTRKTFVLFNVYAVHRWDMFIRNSGHWFLELFSFLR